MWRMHIMDMLCEHMVGYTRQTLAAISVSRVVRGFLGRRTAAHRRTAVATLVKARHHAASKIQRAFRAYYARVAWARHLHLHTTKIQCQWRGMLGRRVAQHVIIMEWYVRPVVLCLLCPRGIFLHALARPWQSKRDAAIIVATSIQKRCRGWHGRLQASMARARQWERMYQEDRAARVLVRFFRHLVYVYIYMYIYRYRCLRHDENAKMRLWVIMMMKILYITIDAWNWS
jgi:hypothetical protein